jgi:hypothetical protein
MAGDALPFVEEFYDLRTQPHVELLLDVRIGHRVVVAFHFHVVINIDPGMFPLGIFIGLRGQRSECEAVERFEQLLA